MTCREFLEHIVERFDGELSPEQAREFDAHRQECPNCRATADEWKELEGWLHAGWPNEEVPPLGPLVPSRISRSWFDTTRIWFARLSTGLVVASLVAIVLLRPSLEWNGQVLRLALGPAPATVQAVQSGELSEAQVREWIQAAINQAMIREKSWPKGVQLAATRAGDEESRWREMALQLSVLQQGQVFLWRQMQQQGLALESLWRESTGRIEPAHGTRYQRQ